jgi:hypothetical protein
MEASMEAATAGQEGTATQDTGTDVGQEATPAAGVPPEVAQRLDEISGRFDQFEPLLQQALTPQEQGEEEQGLGYEDVFQQYGDDQQGIDPDALQQYIDQQAQEQARQLLQPFQERMDQMEQRSLQEDFGAAMEAYPQLADPEFQQQFIPQVEQAAAQIAQGLGPEAAQKLALNPHFVVQQYLAGVARQQAQPGVPGGDQQVPIEGGSGTPGQPEADPKQEWLGMARQGGNSPFGRDPSQF